MSDMWVGLFEKISIENMQKAENYATVGKQSLKISEMKKNYLQFPKVENQRFPKIRIKTIKFKNSKTLIFVTIVDLFPISLKTVIEYNW